VDAWILEAQSAFKRDRRRILYGLIEKRLLETMPYVPLWFEDNIVVSNRRLKNFVPARGESYLPLVKAYLNDF
jgi:ABC-type transport system substrate-binding protein